MKRNQKMSVNLGRFGTIHIGHKDLMGSAKDIMVIGNEIRKDKGLRELEIPEILRTPDFWEFVVVRNALKAHKTNKNPNCGFRSLDLKPYTMPNGQLEYSKLMKLFPNVIRSQRGGKVENRGIWMDLYLLLKLAIKLDKELEHEVYRVFIEDKLLTIRDLGGDAYNDLNILAKELKGLTPTTAKYGHSQMRIDISLAFRDKLSIMENRGYNQINHDILVQDKRLEIKKMCITLIKMKMIKSFSELIAFINNFDLS